ncbi:hypothetical protein KKJFFJLC_00044 [Vibrio phage vB_VpaS_PGB]|nr:hypothetical protein HHKILHMN_00053 [Vibrio phage vB_VpaS_PGA]WVH05587.1 hypothetical protein KKJFFJLC_00044 [Vibrio phage vB_VpaS_PGB]
MKAFKEVPERDWPSHNQKGLVRVLLSSEFLVQQFEEENGIIRLSVCKTKRQGTRWADGITWDELQAIKNAAGFKDKCALEVYPEQNNVVNVANMRHLFVMPTRPDFAWNKSR